MEYAVRCENLTRDFETVRAVDRLTLDVPAGIVFGFLGPNGSGKTTIIRLLLGLLEPSHGRAEVMGFDVQTQSDRVRERCGALLEHHGLYERMSAESNLDYFARINRMPVDERLARIETLLHGAGLWERRKECLKDWSKGMKQRLAVARALLHRPPLLFLDEPTSGFDPVAAADLREHLADMVRQDGTTVFLTTHNLAEAEKLCAQVAVIQAGRLLAVGGPNELRARLGRPQVAIYGHGFDNALLARLHELPTVTGVQYTGNGGLHLDLQPDVAVGPIVSLIVNAGGQVEEVRRGQGSLEDVFLSLMEEHHVE